MDRCPWSRALEHGCLQSNSSSGVWALAGSQQWLLWCLRCRVMPSSHEAGGTFRESSSGVCGIGSGVWDADTCTAAIVSSEVWVHVEQLWLWGVEHVWAPVPACETTAPLAGSISCPRGPCDDGCRLPQWWKLPVSSMEPLGIIPMNTAVGSVAVMGPSRSSVVAWLHRAGHGECGGVHLMLMTSFVPTRL